MVPIDEYWLEVDDEGRLFLPPEVRERYGIRPGAQLRLKEGSKSQHLMALRKAGILITSRQGRNIHYRLSDPRLLGLIRQTAELQGVSLPELAPSPDCSCPNCSKEKRSS